MESPEVRFEDLQKVKVKAGTTRVPVDPKFVVVCEPGTLDVRSTQGRGACAYGAWVGHDGYLNIRTPHDWAMTEDIVNVSITGIRRGFTRSTQPGDPFYDTRFPSRTYSQFVENESFINQAYSHQPQEVNDVE